MNTYLKTYKISLKVIGALFIGNGDTLEKNEYIGMKDSIFVPEIPKLYAYLCEKKLDKEYEKFIRNKDSDLGRWLSDNKIPSSVYEKFGGYKIKIGDIDFSNGVKVIQKFMRDPYGDPYVPGSSLKGALRTALLWNEITKDPQKFEKYKTQISGIDSIGGKAKKDYKYIGENIETDVFNTLGRSEKMGNAVNSCMSSIKISDSKPLSNEDLVVCRKVDYKKDGSEGGNGRNTSVTNRECITPGTVIEFMMTIDTGMQGGFDVEDIKTSVCAFFENYQNVVTRAYIDDEPFEEDNNYIYLGGGAGFISKTIIYGMYNGESAVRATNDVFKRTLSPNVYKMHGHGKDVENGLSPHMQKCTVVNGMAYDMGECRIDISEDQ